jgi:hypothetical protein
MHSKASHWKIYRTRFLIKAKQLDAPLVFTDPLGREHSGRRGDYLVESSDGLQRIAPREIFEDIYVPMGPARNSRPSQSDSRHDISATTSAVHSAPSNSALANQPSSSAANSTPARSGSSSSISDQATRSRPTPARWTPSDPAIAFPVENPRLPAHRGRQC